MFQPLLHIYLHVEKYTNGAEKSLKLFQSVSVFNLSILHIFTGLIQLYILNDFTRYVFTEHGRALAIRVVYIIALYEYRPFLP